MRKDFEDVYVKFMNKFGLKSQMRMCIEEMSELTKELCKYMRYSGTEKDGNNIDAIKEEIADVLNMAEQLEYYFGVEDIEKIREFKVERSKIRDF